MKILAINNYDLEGFYKNPSDVPKHQTWGISYMRECGDIVDTLIYREPKWSRVFGKKT